MKCVIIDDEPLAIEVIESYLQKIGGMEIVAKCTNPLQAIGTLNKHQVDLIFLDIEMPNLTGIDLVKSLDNPPQFIFTTAYPQYALQGFDLNATDYLVKPIPFHRFVKAVSRASEKLESRSQPNSEIIPPAEPDVIQHYDDFIFVRADYENVKIYLNEIRYIEGLKDYIKIHLKGDAKPVLTLSNFKSILEKLPPVKFLRVHRSYVVNVDFITSVQKTRLLLTDTRVPIGDTYKEAVLKRLKL
ncbi:response regulator transcription factor [Salinimicrobium sp. TIG7-5_MAKvit]|uniref:LytR/AlgR family response regulator transcription factor n=1 Tax=Salinimicrobium sp. TIG7-5_MAKvit TaxID=3121289 RepID=UPI003C6E5CBF